MRITIRVLAEDLPKYIGREVIGHGRLVEAALVQPDGRVVVVRFGEPGQAEETTFRPWQTLSVEVGDQLR